MEQRHGRRQTKRSFRDADMEKDGEDQLDRVQTNEEVYVLREVEGKRSLIRCVILKRKWVDARRQQGHETYIKRTKWITSYKDVWTTSTSVHARLHPCL